MSIMIHVSSTPSQLGAQAANAIAVLLNEAVSRQGHARLVLSTGASQFETLDALIGLDVPWSQVEMFHLDEYVALPESHPASFRKYLKERFVSKVPLKAAYFVDGEGDVAGNIAALSRELKKEPVDVGVIGIGENGHIAFNDPPVADFNDKKFVKVVELDQVCRMQQVHDGCFASIDQVPTHALSATIPGLCAAKYMFCSVPASTKALAVKHTVEDAVSTACPATILKEQLHACLYTDKDAGQYLLDK